MHQLVIFALKILISSIRCGGHRSNSTIAMLQTFWPCDTPFQSHHIISRVNYPENWHNLCLRASLLLVIYSLTFFSPHLTIAYLLNFNFGIGIAKNLMLNTGCTANKIRKGDLANLDSSLIMKLLKLIKKWQLIKKKEIYVYTQLIHTVVQLKLIQHCNNYIWYCN